VAGQAADGVQPGLAQNVQQSAPKPKKILDVAIPEEVQKVADEWYKVEANLSDYMRNCLRTTRLAPGGDNRLIIVTKDDGLSYKTLSRPETIEGIETVIGETTGKAVKIEIKALQTGEDFTDSYVEIKKKINFQIEEEDF